MDVIWQASDTFSDRFMIQEMGNPITWRLLKRNNGSVMEEAVFTVQGIILSKDLPPIYDKPRWVTIANTYKSRIAKGNVMQNTSSTLQVPPAEYFLDRTRFRHIFKHFRRCRGDIQALWSTIFRGPTRRLVAYALDRFNPWQTRHVQSLFYTFERCQRRGVSGKCTIPQRCRSAEYPTWHGQRYIRPYWG